MSDADLLSRPKRLAGAGLRALLRGVRASGRAALRLADHEGLDMAASIAFYSLLSIFPLVLALITLFSLFLDADEVRMRVVRFAIESLPRSEKLVTENVEAVIELRGPVGLASGAVLWFSGSSMFGALHRALNRAWEVPMLFRPLHTKLRHLLMALTTVVLFILWLVASAVAELLARLEVPLLSRIGIEHARLVSLESSAIALASAVLLFAVLYRWGPDTRAAPRHVLVSALLAAVLFQSAKWFFVFFLDRFANYRIVYGPLSSVIVLLVWLFLSSIITLYGAEFGAALAAEEDAEAATGT